MRLRNSIGGQSVVQLAILKVVSILFAIMAALIVAESAWTLMTLLAEQKSSNFLDEWAKDSISLLLGLVSMAGVSLGLVVSVVVRLRRSTSFQTNTVFFLCASALGIASQLMPATLISLPLGAKAGWWYGLISEVALLSAAIAFVRFTAWFPVQLQGLQLRGRLARFAGLGMSEPWAWLILLIIPIYRLEGEVPLGEGPLAFGWGFIAWVLTCVMVLALGLVNLNSARQIDDTETYARVRLLQWALGVFGLALIGANLLFLSGAKSIYADLTLGFGYFLHLVLLVHAIFIQSAIEPGLAVRNSVLTAILGVFLVFVFSGLEGIFSDWVVGLLGLPDVASSFLAGGAVAAIVATWQKLRPSDGPLSKLFARSNE